MSKHVERIYDLRLTPEPGTCSGCGGSERLVRIGVESATICCIECELDFTRSDDHQSECGAREFYSELRKLSRAHKNLT